MKNPVIAVFFVLLCLIVAYAVFISLPEAPSALAEPFDRGPEACQEGTVRPCTSGGCSGASTCADGTWSGCKWKTVCSPGERRPCFDGACLTAVRECNSCGTGYTECFEPKISP